MYAYTRHIRYYLALATPEQVAEGSAWYANIRELVAKLAQQYGLEKETVAHVISALSPRCRWENNLPEAENYLRAFTDTLLSGLGYPLASTYKNNRIRAWAILARNARCVGRKTAAFAANLLGDEERVTVDVWAIRAATKCKLAAVDSPSRYYAVQKAYQRVAKGTQWTPAQVQAIVWVTIRAL